MKVKEFFLDFGYGAAMGAAMIIPGVSGGTIAVIFGIYDKIIDSINGLRKNFKSSAAFLLPIVLGAAAAFAALCVPLGYALKYAPLPTTLAFAGLMIGSCPKIIGDAVKNGFKRTDIACIALPFAVILGISFAMLFAGGGGVELGAGAPFYNYIILAIVALFAACALIVPGISGSMIMMIFGFYDPVISAVKGIFTSFADNALILVCAAAGAILGLITIAKLMKLFLTRFPRGAYWAIVGFVTGSIPAIFITYPVNFADVSPSAFYSPLQLGIGVALCIAAAALSYILTLIAKNKFRG